MPSISFPNSDALRLALAAGIVPAEIARQPVEAVRDDSGRTWVRLPEGFPKDAVASLTRIGVTLHGPGVSGALDHEPNWLALVALRPEPEDAARGPVLLSVPDRELAGVTAEVQRLRPQAVSYRIAAEPGRSWLVLRDPPVSVLLRECGAAVEAFVERSERVWIAAGWRHPLEQMLTIPPGEMAVVRPGRRWEVASSASFSGAPGTIALPAQPLADVREHRPAATLETRLRLRPAAGRVGFESLWVFPAERADLVSEFTKETDERVLNKIAIAFATTEPGRGRRVLIRVAVARDSPGVPLSVGPGYVEHQDLKRLYLPVGRVFSPRVRPEILSRVLDVRPGSLVWIEPTDEAGWTTHRVPLAAFRPIADVIRYRAKPPVHLAPPAAATNPFTSARFVAEAEVTAVGPAGGPVLELTAEPHTSLERWLGRLTGKLFAGKAPRGSSPAPPPRADAEQFEADGRVGNKLASPQSLLLGNEWATRRAALEQAVLTDLPRRDPAARCRVWSELADVYSAVGNLADASICWVNALWERDEPAPNWSEAWLRMEARAARIGKEGQDLSAVVRLSGSVPAARAVAAYLTWAADQQQPPPDLLARLPRLLSVLDHQEADLPVRMVWLARRAVARVSDGDALGLARCRDRVFRRLADAGPGLDLDAPSFLRFRGVSGGDRFQTAREWLVRIRDSVHRWIGKLAGPGRLQWAGIDPDAGGTTAYADLLLAWGLSRLGDRSRAKELETQAAAALARASGQGVDPGVHRVLLSAFVDRIRSAQDGRVDRPGLPMEASAELARLDDLGRYAVDKLRAHSGVLEPIDRVNPYRGRDLGPLLGADALAERLGRMLARPDLVPDPADVRELLALANHQPIAGILPRVVLSLLELAPRLDPPRVSEVLSLTARAMDLVPEWVRAGAPPDAAVSIRKYEARLMSGACHAAVLSNQADAFRDFARAVASDVTASGSAAGIAMETSAGPFFRTLRRLGLAAEAGDVLSRIDRQPKVGSRDLGCAIGWFTLGAEDAGNRILNGARERLFVAGVSNLRDRTAIALSYAATLAYAPPRLALGRLEEIFLRLESVATQGATNRYFTLKPLELVDTVVRAVASDDFAVGPGVRGWLDDDEFAIRRRITRELEAGLAGSRLRE